MQWKILSGMANSVDPDQTAPGSTLFAYTILSDHLMLEILGHLPYSLQHLSKALLTRTHNTCFHEEIRKYYVDRHVKLIYGNKSS